MSEIGTHFLEEGKDHVGGDVELVQVQVLVKAVDLHEPVAGVLIVVVEGHYFETLHALNENVCDVGSPLCLAHVRQEESDELFFMLASTPHSIS